MGKVLKNSVQVGLKVALEARKERRPGLSLRSFARQLNISPTTLSLILSGKRIPSEKTCIRIAAKLDLTPEESKTFLNAVVQDKPWSANYLRIRMDHFYAISEWYHYAILALATTDDFDSRADWIAQRMGISIEQTQEALLRLERLGMLTRDLNGVLRGSSQSYTTTEDVVDLALQKSHAQDLDLAKLSLQNDPVDVRDISSVVMAINRDRIPEAKKMIRRFRRSLCAYLETGPKTEVYEVCIQLFPLTRRKSTQ